MISKWQNLIYYCAVVALPTAAVVAAPPADDVASVGVWGLQGRLTITSTD